MWNNTDVCARLRGAIIEKTMRSVAQGTSYAWLPRLWEMVCSVRHRSADVVANALTECGCGCGYGARPTPSVDNLREYLREVA